LMKEARILVVDDEAVICTSCERILSGEKYDVVVTQSSRRALELIEEEAFDVVITDLVMPEFDGMKVLKTVRETSPETKVIMITVYASFKSAVEAVKLGAFDYVAKPFKPSELKTSVEKALEEKSLAQARAAAGAKEKGPKLPFILDNIIGYSPRMQEVFSTITKVAATNSTILIMGETGTGKELIARAIHNHSHRKNMNFVGVDCTALAPSLLESELFGHVKGSFTGAIATKPGYFETANGGTLFLDEIGNISPDIQGKLLRVLQEREFTPVGGSSPKKVNIRLVAATNKDLEEMVADGTFREDLFYRLYVVPMHLPPLRERKEDIEPLAYYFLDIYSHEIGKTITRISPQAMGLLMNFDWPGNVRQLENIIERMVIVAEGDTLEAAEFPQLLRDSKPGAAGAVPSDVEELKRVKKVLRRKAVVDVEKLFVMRALNRNNWNVTRAARAVQMDRANFQALMRKHNIVRRSKHPGEGE
jgi:DNA-binding NtrC family response regulator